MRSANRLAFPSIDQSAIHSFQYLALVRLLKYSLIEDPHLIRIHHVAVLTFLQQEILWLAGESSPGRNDLKWMADLDRHHARRVGPGDVLAPAREIDVVG